MPADIRKIVNGSLRTAVFIVLALFSFLGMVWGMLNFFHLQQFSETSALMSRAGILKSYGNTGILYPAFLLVVMTLFLDSSHIFFIPIYIVQLSLAFVSWYVFAGNIRSALRPLATEKTRREKIGDALFSCTIVLNPFAMASHLAVLEYSFASSFLCLLVSFYIRFSSEWKKGEGRVKVNRALIDTSVISLFWLLLALTRREYLIIGAVPVFFFALQALLSLLKKNRSSEKAGPLQTLRETVAPVMIFAIFAAIIFLTDSLFYSGERLSVSDKAKRALFYRVAAASYFEDEYSIPDFFPGMVGETVLYLAKNDHGYIRSGFTDEMVGAVGTDETTELFWRLAVKAFMDNKKNNAADFAGDVFGYILPPVRTELSLEGKSDTGFVAGCYEIMGRLSPLVTKYYLRGFSILFSFLLIIKLILVPGDSEKRNKIKVLAMPLLLILISAAFFACEGGGIWDHRKALFATCIFVGLLEL